MKALDRTLFTVLSLALGVVACHASDDSEDDNILRSITTDSCIADCDTDSGGSTSGKPPSNPPEGDVCDYRTQTQGGWGTACHGGNPGCFRDANFKKAFPSGLRVGCTAGLKATLKNSKAVELALPTGGKPRKLNPSEAGVYDGNGDPDPKTVLFGQTVALALSVGFDALPDYNPLSTPVPLGALVIADSSSPCVGMTVAEVLAEANDVLGGCTSPLSASQVNACASMINESFVDGGESCSADFSFPPN